MAEQTKNCPFCGEEILAVAKKCKHCGKWLEEDTTSKKPIVNKSKGKGILPIVVSLILLLVIIVGYFLFANDDKQKPNTPTDVYTQIGINKSAPIYLDNKQDIDGYINKIVNIEKQIADIEAEGFKPENANKNSRLKKDKVYYEGFLKTISKLDNQYNLEKDQKQKEALYIANKIDYQMNNFDEYFNIQTKGLEYLSDQELVDIYERMSDSLGVEKQKIQLSITKE